MGVRQYIGARYVPKFCGVFDTTTQYEALSVVDNGSGTSYISKTTVPPNTPLTNTDYWALYGSSSGAIIELKEEVDKLVSEYNTPQNFGAKGDGVTDDTVAIQSAIDAGDVVYFPPSSGEYIFTHLETHANSKLIGLGGVLKFKDNTAADSTQSYYPIWAIGDNTILDSLIIDGNGTRNSQFAVCDPVTLSGKNSKMVNCVINDAPDSGIMLSTADNLQLAHNTINGARDAGIYVNSSGLDNLKAFNISDNIINNCGTSGIACKRESSKGVISGNVIYSCPNGITMEPVSPYSSSTDILINNNYIYDVQGIGIGIRNGNNHTVVGNTIKGSEDHAIQIAVCKNCTVSNNVIESSTTATTGTYRDVIFVYGANGLNEGIVITGNAITINNNSLRGLNVVGNSTDIIITSNAIHYAVDSTEDFVNCSQAGGNSPSNVNVSNNSVSGVTNKQHAITLATVSCNNLGYTKVYTPAAANAATAAVSMPFSITSQGTTVDLGTFRFINPFPSIAARNAHIFKRYDIVPDVLTANKIKLLIATADGAGSTVLHDFVSIDG